MNNSSDGVGSSYGCINCIPATNLMEQIRLRFTGASDTGDDQTMADVETRLTEEQVEGYAKGLKAGVDALNELLDTLRKSGVTVELWTFLTDTPTPAPSPSEFSGTNVRGGTYVLGSTSWLPQTNGIPPEQAKIRVRIHRTINY
jgi:hypothetical protein